MICNGAAWEKPYKPSINAASTKRATNDRLVDRTRRKTAHCAVEPVGQADLTGGRNSNERVISTLLSQPGGRAVLEISPAINRQWMPAHQVELCINTDKQTLCRTVERYWHHQFG
jgi:hypothetical protein